MKKIYLIQTVILIVFFLFPVLGFTLPAAVWHTGQLTLIDRTVLAGDLSYNWSTEIVSLRQTDGRIRAFSATQIEQFGWFDYSSHKQRNFIVLSDLVDNRAKPNFYEVCMDGPLAVVRRLRRPHGLFKRTFSHPAYYYDQPALAENTDHFTYYVYDAGHLRAFDRFYLDIYEPLMNGYDREIRQYVLTHNINERTLLGRLVLIDHYNFLVQQDPRTASARGRSNANN